jgi:hypothetical protein
VRVLDQIHALVALPHIKCDAALDTRQGPRRFGFLFCVCLLLWEEGVIAESPSGSVILALTLTSSALPFAVRRLLLLLARRAKPLGLL